LIDKIAAAGNLPSYTPPAQPDGALRATHALALDLAEDFRDLGLDIGVAWEGRWIRLSWPGGSDFSFTGISPGAFQLDRDRTHVIRREDLLTEIAIWVEVVQRELS
jgi:hypothetical protein